MTPVLVPSSPSRTSTVAAQIQKGYEEYHHSALYGSLPSASSSKLPAILEPALPSKRPSFLASSASANRCAGVQSRKANATRKKKTFQRNEGSTLTSKAPPLTGDKRDDSMRLVEDLPIGPRKMEPPSDDPHFLKYEPTSGMALRRRKIPHKQFEAHLEGRCYIPISKIYSIATPEPSDDGDVTIPVEVDWLTMGVIVKRSEPLATKTMLIDAMGRRLDKHGNPVHDVNRPPLISTDEKKKGDSIRVGISKELAPKNFIIFTLLDLSHPPDKFGRHDGSQEFELSVFESDSSWVEPGGKRMYSGGSKGAYEKLQLAGEGTLVCILNPRLRKGYKGKVAEKGSSQNEKNNNRDQERSDEKDEGSRIFRLNARSGETVAIVGVAKDYGSCQAGNCSTFVDKRTKVDVCDVHIGYCLEKTQNGRSQLQSSWRQSTFVNDNSLSNGMATGSKPKQYVFQSNKQEDPSSQGSRFYDVSAHYGRVKERRIADEGRVEELEALQKKLGKRPNQMESSDLLSESQLREKAVAKVRSQKLAQIDLEEKQGKGVLNNIMYDSAATKVIEAARKSMQEQKRRMELPAKGSQQAFAKGTKRVAVVNECEDAGVPTGSYRALNGDVKRLSDSSSKLLSRHSVKSTLLPKPSLGRKKLKLAPTVRPPPGESFYAEESSDEELDKIMQSDALTSHLQGLNSQVAQNRQAALITMESDSDSDLEIIPS